jgi:hypothetical protein
MDSEAKQRGLTRDQWLNVQKQQWVDQQQKQYGPSWRNVGPRMRPAPSRDPGPPWWRPEFWPSRLRQPRAIAGFPSRPLVPIVVRRPIATPLQNIHPLTPIAMRRPITPPFQGFPPTTIRRPFPLQPPPGLDSLRRLREQPQSSARRTQQWTQQGVDSLRRLREQTQRMNQPAFDGLGRVGLPRLGGPYGMPGAYRAPGAGPIPPVANWQPIGARSRPGVPTIGPLPGIQPLGGRSRPGPPSNTLTPGQPLVRWSDPTKLGTMQNFTFPGLEFTHYGPGKPWSVRDLGTGQISWLPPLH